MENTKDGLFKNNKNDEFTVPGGPITTTKKEEPKKEKRRKEEKKDEFGGLTSEEMDILLNGGSLDDLKKETPAETQQTESVKNLFED